MGLCTHCHATEAIYTNEGGLCERCWWAWWFDGIEDTVLENIAENTENWDEERDAARVELELRKTRRTLEENARRLN